MFTGLIAEIGTIGTVKRCSQGLEYEVHCIGISGRLVPGASIAVNGVCQTVSMLTKYGFRTEAVESTIRKTTIGSLGMGDRVNLEPSLRAGDPLDGHLMQGHVSEKGILLSVKSIGIAKLLTVGVESTGGLGIIREGSVGIDGVSLTVSSRNPRTFSVQIIPETWENTTFRLKRAGDLLNIEGDVLVRASAVEEGRLNENKLIEWGY